MRDIDDFILAKLEKVSDKIDEIKESQISMNMRLDQYNGHLQEHMRRSDLLEKRINDVELERIQVLAVKTAKRKRLISIGKWLGILSLSISIVYGVLQIIAIL